MWAAAGVSEGVPLVQPSDACVTRRRHQSALYDFRAAGGDIRTCLAIKCPSIAVIGAGLLGLTITAKLARAGYQVCVFEAREETGGLSGRFDYGEFIWDRFYHVILPSDGCTVELATQLDLADKLQWRQVKTGLLWQDQLLSMSNIWELLSFPKLTLLDKARLAAGLLYCAQHNNGASLTREPAAAWLKRVFGRRLYNELWESLLEAKFGPLKHQAQASLLLASLKRGYSARSRHTGQERMGYLKGGMQTLINALERAISAKGGEINCRTKVERLTLGCGGKIAVHLTGKAEPRLFDKVVSTVPSPLFQKMAQGFPGVAAGSREKPHYLGVICLVLLLRKHLTPYYVTNLIQNSYPFTGIIELTNLVRPKEVGGYHVVFLPRYDVPSSPWYKKEPGLVAEEFTSALEQRWPRIREIIVRWYLHREPLVQAVWPAGSRPPRPPYTNGTQRVLSVTSALSNDTLNNNAIIKLANEAVASIVGGGEAVHLTSCGS